MQTLMHTYHTHKKKKGKPDQKLLICMSPLCLELKSTIIKKINKFNQINYSHKICYKKKRNEKVTESV